MRLPEENWPEPIRFLGNGSNVLMDDRGMKGTIVLCRDDEFAPQLLEENAEFADYRMGAGVFLPRLAKWAASQSLSGAEYMVGVPGTLGGAVVQNAGANDQDLKMILQSVDVFDLASRSIQTLSADECELQYRDSALKKRRSLVRSVSLRFRKSDSLLIQKQTEANLQYRKQKTPWTQPSLGSTFARIPSGESWIYPGALLEKVGLKGFRQGQMGFSEIHANYLINHGGGRFEEAQALIQEAQKRVEDQFSLKIPLEILLWSDHFNPTT